MLQQLGSTLQGEKVVLDEQNLELVPRRIQRAVKALCLIFRRRHTFFHTVRSKEQALARTADYLPEHTSCL